MCLVRVTINIYFILHIEEDVVVEAEVEEEQKEVDESIAVEIVKEDDTEEEEVAKKKDRADQQPDVGEVQEDPTVKDEQGHKEVCSLQKSMIYVTFVHTV